MKERIGWTVAHPEYGLYLWTTRDNRRTCQEDFEDRTQSLWKDLKICGYKIIKVKIIAIK